MKSALSAPGVLMTILTVALAACAPTGLATPSGGGIAAADGESVGTAAVSSAGGVSHSASEEPQGLSASNLPPVIAAVYPSDGATACRRPQIGADILLTDQMRKDGVFDPTTAALRLDGHAVSPQVVRTTMTFPASRATILFTPAADLPLGSHEAALDYPSNGTSSYTWSFTVADIPCE